MIFWAQRRVCRRFGVAPLRPGRLTMSGVGLSRGSDLLPLNAVRHPPVGQTNGWYVWRGEPAPQDDGFFSPVHVEHVVVQFPELVPYLALPPGMGVVLAPGYEDVWHDDAFLEP
ncbi:immunity protein Imm33 domain-containing protein [Actinoplanes sp. RD1]|uniref:immunity protein Imm33 domain-containing protein n=1 Tax=Actinoplanes sp. RD1 TaxID=3064538 RepID=UPI002742623A|nr:hypothetical protein [Actinoplanes sp. RD1]